MVSGNKDKTRIWESLLIWTTLVLCKEKKISAALYFFFWLLIKSGMSLIALFVLFGLTCSMNSNLLTYFFNILISLSLSLTIFVSSASLPIVFTTRKHHTFFYFVTQTFPQIHTHTHVVIIFLLIIPVGTKAPTDITADTTSDKAILVEHWDSHRSSTRFPCMVITVYTIRWAFSTWSK